MGPMAVTAWVKDDDWGEIETFKFNAGARGEAKKVEASRHKGVNTWATCTQTYSQNRPPSLPTVLTHWASVCVCVCKRKPAVVSFPWHLAQVC